MGYSVDGLGPVSITQQRPMAYALQNNSQVSSSFEDSMKIAQGGVTPPSPVSYPTAQIETNRINQAEASQETNRAYNQIASSFGSAATTYDANSQSFAYATVGSNIDLFA
jgi:hypothetical protein